MKIPAANTTILRQENVHLQVLIIICYIDKDVLKTYHLMKSTQKWEPEESPLIRLQFDINDVLQIRHPQPITLNALRVILGNHLVKSGIRKIEHPTANSLNRVRKSVPLTNGFRKFTISNFVRAGVKHDVRQMLVDHKGGYLDESYLRLTDEEILSEYMKAEPYLTIDESLRLKQ